MLEYRGVKPYIAIACVVVLCSLTAGVKASDWRLAQNLDRVLSSPALDGAFVGILSVDLLTDRILYSRNADFLFLPASNQKLLTTAAALNRFGPDFTYATELYSSGSIAADSVFRGDLVIVGTGDPSLSKSFGVDPDSLFLSWADSLKQRGIAKIDGRVMADESAFDRERLGYGWDWHYLSSWYAPEISALSCYGNSVTVEVDPGKRVGDETDIKVSPRTSYVSVDNGAYTSVAGSESAVSVRRKPGTNQVSVAGSLALDGGSRSYRVSVSDPALFFAHRVTEVLRQGSIAVAGEPGVCGGDCERSVLLWSHHSPHMESIVTVTNRLSSNLGGEMLLKTLGAEAYGRGTFEDGCRAVKAYLSSIGVDTSSLHSADGSGLSRRNLVSPRILVEVLKACWETDSTRVFYNSLPISGVCGTLENRMQDTLLLGRIHAKTGTLDQTSVLAGYLVTTRGRPLAFALMTNHFVETSSKIRSVEEEVISALVRYRPRYSPPWERR
jgi:D-alanyl-D-alanine carboxypeptidase/D-alanyl-D-alanine-endopeptidase (penicillin-binding protein 4)